MKTIAFILFLISGLILFIGIEGILKPLPKEINEPQEIYGYKIGLYIGLFLPFIVIFILGVFLYVKANKNAKILKNESKEN